METRKYTVPGKEKRAASPCPKIVPGKEKRAVSCPKFVPGKEKRAMSPCPRLERAMSPCPRLERAMSPNPKTVPVKEKRAASPGPKMVPVKEKRAVSPSPRSVPEKKRAASPSPKINYPYAPKKYNPRYLKPTKSSAIDASKQHARKPSYTHKFPLDNNTPLSSSTSKVTHVATYPFLQSFSISGKTMAVQRSAQNKNLKAPIEDSGKQNSDYTGPVTKSSTSNKKKGTENTTAVQEPITITRHANVDEPDYTSETRHRDQESSFLEAEEQAIQIVLSNNEKGTDNLEPKEQETLIIGKIEAERENEDAEVVAAESPSQQRKEYAISNSIIEETAIKLREQRKNKVKALAGAFETVISLQETK